MRAPRPPGAVPGLTHPRAQAEARLRARPLCQRCTMKPQAAADFLVRLATHACWRDGGGVRTPAPPAPSLWPQAHTAAAAVWCPWHWHTLGIAAIWHGNPMQRGCDHLWAVHALPQCPQHRLRAWLCRSFSTDSMRACAVRAPVRALVGPSPRLSHLREPHSAAHATAGSTMSVITQSACQTIQQLSCSLPWDNRV